MSVDSSQSFQPVSQPPRDRGAAPTPAATSAPASVPNTWFKGRWGYYPCGYETWRRLKRLRFLRLTTVRRLAACERWNRKQPQNRVLRRRVRRDGRPVGWEQLGPRPEPAVPPFMIEQQWGRRRVAHDWIEAWYREAKYPSAEPRAAWEEARVRQIAELTKHLETWFGGT